MAGLSATLLLNAAGGLAAQEVELPWNVAIRGGVLAGVNENAWTYVEFKKPLGLLNPSASATVGYDFTPKFGLRLGVSLDRNSAACNSANYDQKFYPYSFRSVGVFADAVANVRQGRSPFIPKFYGGLGVGRGFNYQKTKVDGAYWTHPRNWQEDPAVEPDDYQVYRKSLAFAFRLGFLAEYKVSNEVGIVADFCLESFTDDFDGFMPPAKDQAQIAAGYGGFPFDFRGVVSLGIAYHF